MSLRSSYFQHGLLEPLPQIRDIEWFDENGDVMRSEDWSYTEGRLLCVRRALRVDAARVEVNLLLTNTTAAVRTFQLPQPALSWWLRVDTADVSLAEHKIEHASVDVAAHSLQCLTAVVEAPAAKLIVHAPGDCATEPLVGGASRTGELPVD